MWRRRARAGGRSAGSCSPTLRSCACPWWAPCATPAGWSRGGRSRRTGGATSSRLIRPTPPVASPSTCPCATVRTLWTSSPTDRSARSASSIAPTACSASCCRSGASSMACRPGNAERRCAMRPPTSTCVMERRAAGRCRRGSTSSGVTRCRTGSTRMRRSSRTPRTPGPSRATSWAGRSPTEACATSPRSTCGSKATTRGSRATRSPCSRHPAAARPGA